MKIHKTYKVYRENNGKRGKLIAAGVESWELGTIMNIDIDNHFTNCLSFAVGKKIAKGMKADGRKDWVFYPEDFGVPVYRIVEEK